MEDEERESVAAELARERDEARAQARRSPTSPPVRADEAEGGGPVPAGAPASAARAPATDPPPPPAPAAPSARDVNELWPAAPPQGGGGRLVAAVERLLAGRLGAQRDWNAAQVRLDNELLRWVEERFDATHAHYDALLGALGRRLDEADERHRRLEQELVAHVREMVRRIELATADASRGRSALELQIDDLRARLDRLERAADRDRP